MNARNRNTLGRVNRLAALRTIRAYRTVSEDAAAFLAGSITLDLVTAERAQLWALKSEGLSEEDAASRGREIKARTIALWQERWSTDNGKASWTKRILPSVERSLNSNGSARMTFHLSQALNGHGCFGT